MSNLITDFWDHSISCWDKDNFRQVCLNIQNQHMVDINIILLCHWLNANDQRLANPDTLFKISADHQRLILRPLRNARKGLKGSALYEDIKSLELRAERMEQEAFIAVIDMSKGAEGLTKSLTRYFTFMSIIAPEDEAVALTTILDQD